MQRRGASIGVCVLVALGACLTGATGARAAPVEVVAFSVRATPDAALPDPGIELALGFADGSAFLPSPSDPFVGVGTNFRAGDAIGSFETRSAANEPDFAAWAALLTDGRANNGGGGDGVREFWIRTRFTSEGAALDSGVMRTPGFLLHECQFFVSLGARFGAGACGPGKFDLQGFALTAVRFELLAVGAAGAAPGALDLGFTILAVPEPSAASLLLVGLAVLSVHGRRRGASMVGSVASARRAATQRPHGSRGGAGTGGTDDPRRNRGASR